MCERLAQREQVSAEANVPVAGLDEQVHELVAADRDDSDVMSGAWS